MGMSIPGEGTACERLRGKKVKNGRKPSAAGGGVWEKARWSGRGRKLGAGQGQLTEALCVLLRSPDSPGGCKEPEEGFQQRQGQG